MAQPTDIRSLDPVRGVNFDYEESMMHSMADLFFTVLARVEDAGEAFAATGSVPADISEDLQWMFYDFVGIGGADAVTPFKLNLDTPIAIAIDSRETLESALAVYFTTTEDVWSRGLPDAFEQRRVDNRARAFIEADTPTGPLRLEVDSFVLAAHYPVDMTILAEREQLDFGAGHYGITMGGVLYGRDRAPVATTGTPRLVISKRA